jgi:hypothetical protein
MLAARRSRAEAPANSMRPFLLFLALLAVPLVGQPRTLKPDDFAAIRDVSSPQLSPDGQWVAYTVRTTDLTKDKTYTLLESRLHLRRNQAVASALEPRRPLARVSFPAQRRR